MAAECVMVDQQGGLKYDFCEIAEALCLSVQALAALNRERAIQYREMAAHSRETVSRSHETIARLKEVQLHPSRGGPHRHPLGDVAKSIVK
jgi:hypothetical protein